MSDIPTEPATATSNGRRYVSADEIADALGRYRHTPEQKAVIEAPLEPLLVVAGAGSGKTDTMASRVVWLVANDIVRPAQILGLTFTRKAAGELAERIGQRLRLLEASGLWKPQADEDGTEGLGEAPTVSTYNAYAGRIVSEHGLRLGIEPDSRMLSESASWQFAHEVVASWDGDMSDITVGEASVSAGVLATSGELKEHQRDVDDLRAYYEGLLAGLETIPYAPRKRSLGDAGKALRIKAKGHLQLLPLVEGYTRLKAERSALDFSDQIAFAARLAERFEQIGEGERLRYRAVLLDEFQDTSAAQISFLASVFARGEQRPGVIAVGDPHQSIFGWRGASATTLASFRQEFALPGEDVTPVASLSTSWRNDQAVLDVANVVAAPLTQASRVPVEPLRARPDAGPGTVQAARLETDVEEARYVARWIAERRAVVNADGHERTAAVLCRKRSQFVPVLEALDAEGIPAEAVGLGGLLQTPEVVDLVSMLWVVDDPGRGDHLMRLLTGPAMRLGPADLDALGTWARELHERHREEAAAALARAAESAGSAGESQSPGRSEGEASPGLIAPVARREADLAEGTRDDISLVEAIGELPDESWRGRDDERFSPEALARLAGFHTSLNRLRLLTGLPLADFVGEAERVLGLDIEVLARPGHDPSTARAHLDAFADVAGTFSAQAERPTLGGFLDWLDAAREEERGLEMPAIEVNPRAVQVLTVHAAKGLEWDLVAVPGLVEGSFPGLDGRTQAAGDEWAFSQHKVKGWLSGLASIPYDLRGDRGGLPAFDWRAAADSDDLNDRYGVYREAGQAHERVEERRLAYVAFTRARSEMLLTAAPWTSGSKSPRLASSFLEEVIAADLAEVLQWSPMPPTLVDGEPPTNPLEENAHEVIWPVDAMADHRAAMTPGARLVEQARERLAEGGDLEAPGQAGLPLEGTPEDRDLEVELLLAERARERRREDRSVVLPSHLSASAVVALASDPATFARRLRRPMPSEPAVAARRGTAFHAWVEQHYGSAALVDVDELPGFFDEEPATDDALPRLKENFLASEWAARTPLDLEVSVETVVAGYAIRGRIDAVFARADGGVTVVDWKTGARPDAATLRHRSLQLATYALAYARLKGLDPAMVDGAFFYAASGETYRPPMQTQREIEELLVTATEG
ncbi:ATP-dependent DNA helicase [Dermacoccus sp. PAMC28757]|uniref:ATP-dependent helicase n=1 Tax=Dermacoccus sp. PAMC28757 TaxID=2762331 RepID=UPI0021074159|nr:ATP-dependent DNA helicase [Dermacoccus sp. PAMC28757]